MSTAPRKGWRGYNFSRPIDGSSIPQRVQNLVIRTHCQGLGLEYLLSATEYSMDESFMILESLYGELSSVEGIVFYSVHMLPQSQEKRKEIYQAALKKGAGIRFALEELSILNEKDIRAIEELMLSKELMANVQIDEKVFSN